MGKYMKKGKGVGKIEVSHGSLGVRTRARALALEKEKANNAVSIQQTDFNEGVGDQALSPPQAGPHLMELRSRRLERVPMCEKGKENHAISQASESSAKPLQQSNNRQVCESPSSLKPRKSSRGALRSRSMQDMSSVAASGDELTHLRPSLAALSSRQSSFNGSCDVSLAAAAAATVCSTQSLSCSIISSSPIETVSIDPKPTLGIMTRNQRQLMMSSPACSENGELDASMAGVSRREAEVEPYFGESPMIAGPRDFGSRECTPESFVRDVEAPGSTSRTRCSSQVRSYSAPPFTRSSQAPSASEIEAFLASAEQKERRRFIDRYNFDPVTERPLRGRYEWCKL